jgi:hypothetical protein
LPFHGDAVADCLSQFRMGLLHCGRLFEDGENARLGDWHELGGSVEVGR